MRRTSRWSLLSSLIVLGLSSPWADAGEPGGWPLSDWLREVLPPGIESAPIVERWVTDPAHPWVMSWGRPKVDTADVPGSRCLEFAFVLDETPDRWRLYRMSGYDWTGQTRPRSWKLSSATRFLTAFRTDPSLIAPREWSQDHSESRRQYTAALALVAAEAVGDWQAANSAFRVLCPEGSPPCWIAGHVNVEEERVRRLQHSLSGVAMSRLGRLFHAAPRETLVRECQRFLKLFPESLGTRVVRPYVPVLKGMIAEDRTYEAPDDLAALPLEERVGHLIYQLRDERGGRSGMGGVSALHGVRDAPAAQLLAIGYDAVPFLIDALDDKRLSRVGAGFPDTIGRCCQQILRHLTGEQFRYGVGLRSSRDRVVAVQECARNWWRDYERLGEEGLLVDRVERGDRDSRRYAERLSRRYPTRLLPALQRAIENCDSDYLRSGLINVLASRVRDRAVVEPILVQLAMEQGWRQSRVTALARLRRVGASDKAETLLLRFLDEERWFRPAASGFPDELADLFGLVSRMRSAAALDRIAAKYDRLEPSLRFSLEEQLRGRSRSSEESPAHSKWEHALEQLLVRMLDDTARAEFISANRYDGENHPRLCHYAAGTLSELWPERYQFHYAGTDANRDEWVQKARATAKATLRGR